MCALTSGAAEPLFSAKPSRTLPHPRRVMGDAVQAQRLEMLPLLTEQEGGSNHDGKLLGREWRKAKLTMMHCGLCPPRAGMGTHVRRAATSPV